MLSPSLSMPKDYTSLLHSSVKIGTCLQVVILQSTLCGCCKHIKMSRQI